MDNFKEEIVTRRGGKLKRVLMLTLVYTFFAIFAFMGFIFGVVPLMQMDFSLPTIISVVVGGGAAWLLWRYKDTLDIEYEYTFTNGEMDFAKVLGQKRRKHLLSLRLKDCEAGGDAEGDNYKRYSTMQGLITTDLTLNDDSRKRFLYFIKDGNKHMLLIEPTENMWGLIAKTNQRIVSGAGISR